MFLSLSLTLPLLFCLAAGQQQDASTYSLQQSRYNPAIAKLDAELSRTRLDTLLDNAQYLTDPASEEMEGTPWFRKGFRWSSDDGNNDADTTSWRPKGVATLADTGLDIYQGNSEVLAVTWMDVRNVTGMSMVPGLGVRVTFVRKGSADVQVSNKGYSHVLLVEPFLDGDGKADFRVLDGIETGGMVWRGRWIYITDAKLGVRVFDVESMYKVSVGTHIGRNSAGKYAASEYPFIMPQAYTYTPLSFKLTELTPTVLSLDRNATTPRLLIGETAPLSTRTSNFAAFPFDATSGLLATNSTRAVNATWAWRTNVHGCRGMVYSPTARAYFIVQSFADDVRGNILRWLPGSWSDEYDETLSPGPEGAAIRPDNEELWVLGGLPGNRYVMALSTTLTNATNIPDAPGAPVSTTIIAPSEESKPAEPLRLTPGIIAGISIGCIAFLLSLAATIFLILRLRRRQKEPYNKAELMSTEVQRANTGSSSGDPFEKEAKVVYEMGVDQRFELPVGEQGGEKGEEKGLSDPPRGAALGIFRKPAPTPTPTSRAASRSPARSPARGDTVEFRPPPQRQEERRWEDSRDHVAHVRDMVERAGRRAAPGVRRKSTEELVSPITPGGWR